MLLKQKCTGRNPGKPGVPHPGRIPGRVIGAGCGCLALLMVCASAAWSAPWNNPYPAGSAGQNTLYSSFEERPKHLDPVRSYSSDEYAFIAQIYEPPLQYHFLKRPYQLVPLTADGMPEVTYIGRDGRRLPDDVPAAEIAFSEYLFKIKPGIRYQPHPALAVDENGDYRYHALRKKGLDDIYRLADFAHTGTRELLAADYVYQIKRMAHPGLHCPIAGVMSDYIVGFKELAQTLRNEFKDKPIDTYVDLRNFDLAGVSVVDPHTYKIRIRGKYPQFLYWQAMPFFAPMPWEADRFYQQPGFAEKNLTLDWYPIGTGGYMLAENNPNLRMVMVRNPNFHGETYPAEGEPQDVEQGLLADAGRPIPFIDRAVYSLEKESIPRWNKFLQGYYDNSGISSDTFDQAVTFSGQGEASLTEEMQAQGIQLVTAVATSTYYMGFNMLDKTLGGLDERARKLRQAISIAVDFEEYISIFLNGRGIAAQGPVPPGIFGHHEGRKGVNPYVYDWVNGKPVRKTLAVARKLLREAGYENGIDRETGRPLTLNFEARSSGPDDKARLNWIRNQFEALGLQLVIRATDYNRFRDKMLKGTGQIFMWGWNADYPDPENFLFLLYGPNGKAEFKGENAANYANPEFDRLFDRMKNMENSPQRQDIIDRMVEIARRDAPWMWGLHPKSFSLHHAWYHNVKPNLMANNTLKYKRLEPGKRAQARAAWNQPVLWPFALLGGVVLASIVPAVVSYRRREKSAAL